MIFLEERGWREKERGGEEREIVKGRGIGEVEKRGRRGEEKKEKYLGRE